MKHYTHTLTGILTVACLSLAVLVLATGCPEKEEQEPEVTKPGVKVVNSHCPIMGTELDSDNVPADLTREFLGEKIGFCCAECLPKWDELSEMEKAEKLDEVSQPPE